MLCSLLEALTVMAYDGTKGVGTKYGTAADNSSEVLDFDSLNQL